MKAYWNEVSATDIADMLGIKQVRKIKLTLEKFGIEQRRTAQKRLYLVPPFTGSILYKNDMKYAYTR